jgi:hypothetical protein
MFLSATQAPSATPRGHVPPLYVPAVRTKLVRLFYSAFTNQDIQKHEQLRNLESALLTNSMDGSPVGFLAQDTVIKLCLRKMESAIFASNLLSFTPVSDENRMQRVSIRDQLIGTLSCANTEEIPMITKILIACPYDNLNSGLIEFITTHLSPDAVGGSCIDIFLKIVQSLPDTFVDSVVRENPKVISALMDLACPLSSQDPDAETIEVLKVRQQALTGISLLIALSQDPLSILNLSSDGRTIGQRVFDILFSELMLETHFRKDGLQSYYSDTLQNRIRRIQDSNNILVRMAVGSAEHGKRRHPLDDYSFLVPSLLGLIRGLLAKSCPSTREIDAVISSMVSGDVGFLKELSLPELVGTPFELETCNL